MPISNINPSTVQDWLESITPIAESTEQQDAAARELLGNDGLAAVIGLMLGSRQTFYTQLAHLPLDTAANVSRASVIQGQIKGIDLLRQTLLELATPAETGTEGANS
jgi:hypothetical protein